MILEVLENIAKEITGFKLLSKKTLSLNLKST